MTIDDRTIRLFFDLSEKFKPSAAEYCIEEEDEDEVKVEDIPGCKLILRAYKMGVADKLGDCKPKDEEKEGADQICRLRQLDEPYFHYTYRKIVKIASGLFSFPLLQWGKNSIEQFKYQYAKIETLSDFKSLILNGSPKSSHHFYTNLPPPNGYILNFLREAFLPNDCIERFAKMPNTLLVDDLEEYPPKSFRFIIGQLLFNSGYKAPVGYCRDYQIHWEAPLDSCNLLSTNTVEFLEDTGSWSHVRSLLTREGLDGKMAEINAKMKTWEIKEEPKDEEENDEEKKDKNSEKKKSDSDGTKKDDKDVFAEGKAPTLSFHCFMVTDDEPQFKDYSFSLENRELVAYELKLKGQEIEKMQKVPVDWFKQVAKLLIKDFNYAGYLSKQAIRNRAQGDLSSQFSSYEKFMFSKTEILADTDIMLENNWLHERGDLLKIYPWYLHLHHFIGVFRKRYHARWTDE